MQAPDSFSHRMRSVLRTILSTVLCGQVLRSTYKTILYYIPWKQVRAEGGG